ncbi:sensor histidine kinase [Balneola vulgaris]|uniref:sensor histidine kinase n=1 Tax=Balneola vulgaris TaxID=287535 RepID=UPI00036131A8|nr:histidine kinase dimerization/phosphoacceptor domain -containing protein [Balneola vulgaris]
MNLGRKIISSFILLSILLIGIGVIWEIYYSKNTNKQFNESRSASSVVQHTNEMEVNLYQTLIYLSAIRDLSKTESTQEDIQELPTQEGPRNRFELSLAQYDRAYMQLEQEISNSQLLLSQVYELDKRVDLYRSLSEEWLTLVDEENIQSDIVFLSSLEPYFINNILPKFDQIRKIAIDQQSLRINDLNQQLKRGRILNRIATLFILMLGLLIAFYLYRSIARPLRKLIDSVNEFGRGNLEQRIKVKSDDEIAQVANAFNAMAENLQRQTISTEYLDNVLESISEGIFVTDISGKVTRVNGAGANMLKLPKESILDRSITEFFIVEEKKPENERDGLKEYRLITDEKGEIPILFSAAELKLNETKRGTVFVVTNITELKEAEEDIKKSLVEKGLMLAEIHHRVKNNLAVVSGLLQLQVSQSKSEDVTKALSDSQHRIQSIALVHEKLYSNESLAYIEYDKYIEDLVKTIRSTYVSKEKEIQVETNLEPISLNINQAIPSSLLINEILVNCFKHAFSNQEKGNIHIQIQEEKSTVEVTITDDGKGIDINDFNDSESLGVTLIKTLTSQLMGTYTLEPREDKPGTIFKVSFRKEI